MVNILVKMAESADMRLPNIFYFFRYRQYAYTAFETEYPHTIHSCSTSLSASAKSCPEQFGKFHRLKKHPDCFFLPAPDMHIPYFFTD